MANPNVQSLPTARTPEGDFLRATLLKKRIIKPNFRVVKIDETKYYTDPELVKAAGKIYAVFIYDSNRQVFLCELTPSYEFHYVESTTEESLSDEHYDNLMEANRHRESSEYHHTAFAATIPAEHTQPFSQDWEPEEEQYATDEAYNELVEDLIGDERANPTF